MICLEVQPYCSECCDFKPDVVSPIKIYAGDNDVMQSDTVVRCEYARRCEAIKRYLLRRIGEKDGDGK